MTRGDIVMCNNLFATGHEQSGYRPAIIVSNDFCNRYSPVIEVIYTTTQQKRKLPTHVLIQSTPHRSTALCEAIYSVDKSRIRGIIGHCTQEEMNNIDSALLISLGLSS